MAVNEIRNGNVHALPCNGIGGSIWCTQRHLLHMRGNKRTPSHPTHELELRLLTKPSWWWLFAGFCRNPARFHQNAQPRLPLLLPLPLSLPLPILPPSPLPILPLLLPLPWPLFQLLSSLLEKEAVVGVEGAGATVAAAATSNNNDVGSQQCQWRGQAMAAETCSIYYLVNVICLNIKLDKEGEGCRMGWFGGSIQGGEDAPLAPRPWDGGKGVGSKQQQRRGQARAAEAETAQGQTTINQKAAAIAAEVVVEAVVMAEAVAVTAAMAMAAMAVAMRHPCQWRWRRQQVDRGRGCGKCGARNIICITVQMW